jgi:hypothetical protein
MHRVLLDLAGPSSGVTQSLHTRRRRGQDRTRGMAYWAADDPRFFADAP